MKVWKVADIIDNREVVFCPPRGWKHGDAAALLSSLPAAEDPRKYAVWNFTVSIGVGKDVREVLLSTSPSISDSQPAEIPAPLGEQLLYFRDQLFMAERAPRTPAEREEFLLRAKKLVYDQQAEVAKLKAAVANLEAASEYAKSGPQRAPIPEDVKLLVWARDRGACVQCGATNALHFDHVIPVAKGGGNSAANIQILCQLCNLRKSDKIATP